MFASEIFLKGNKNFLKIRKSHYLKFLVDYTIDYMIEVNLPHRKNIRR